MQVTEMAMANHILTTVKGNLMLGIDTWTYVKPGAKLVFIFP